MTGSPQQFEFTSKQRTVLFAAMGLGLFSLALGAFYDQTAHHAQTWSNILHNCVFFLGISFISLFLYSASTTAYGGWFVGFKRVWEAMFSNIPVFGTIFFVLIVGGMWGEFHHLYHWADADLVAKDRILRGKVGFLNKINYTWVTAFIVLVWSFWAMKIRENSVAEDTEGGLERYKNLKFWTATFLPLGGATSAFGIWYWLMSLDAHWFSTMYAWQGTASFLVTAVSISVLLIIFLQRQGYMQHITLEHQHDLGKYMFGFSVFWTYLWFSQFMLIWYCNNGEETVYFHTRMTYFAPLFYLNLFLNFIAPFFVLVRNTSKRRTGIMVFMACMLLFSHWLDFFLMVKPAVWEGLQHAAHATPAAGHEGAAHVAEAHEAHESSFMLGFMCPGLTELGMFIGFLALFAFNSLRTLAAAALVPANDPYLEESAHHHV